RATIEIVARSNRADLVSGGDVLLEVQLAEGTQRASVSIDVNGRDVTAEFAVRDDGRFMGIVEHLELGENVVSAGVGSTRAELVVNNHPIGGPIFSGPQIQPWYCLDGALDEQCNRPTSFEYQYVSSITGDFGPYDPDNPPSDVASTTTDEGKTVPYVVRVETGSINRGVYRIAVLTTPDDQWDRWSGPSAWNHKLLVPHGSGCNSGHAEGVAPDVMLGHALSRGFAVMSHALEDNSENCNLVVQAESVMMLKEHLVEAYGDVRYQMGVGCSGGSIAQLHMANAFPGLYDGLIVGCTYPDVPVNDLLDCQVLLRYFTEPGRWGPGVVWTEQDMARAAGLQSFSVCIAWAVSYSGIFDPDAAGGCDVPDREPERLYNAETNQGGVRCSYQDYAVNVLGTRPPHRWGPIEEQVGRGFANRPYDNVGMLYGLRAWQQGQLSTAQFVDLNAKAGSVGIDYETLPTRIEGDPAGIVNAYRSGQMNEAHELDRVPIIDIPIPADRYEFHDNYKSWALEQRLVEANGHGDNHVIWYGPDEQGQVYIPTGIHTDTRPFLAMDRWLSAIEKDLRDVPIEQKVVDDRPDDVTDRCETPDRATCDLLFGSAGNIRWAAGMPTLANDVIKCQLQPLRRSDYAPNLLTDAQWETLNEAFPTGVCDWTRPGVGQQDAVAWQTYEDGPGGRPLGPAPTSAVPPASAPAPGALPATGGGLAAGVVLVVAMALRVLARGRREST
ncbi:MAG TPA: DUF6351 family protein, partial [Nitriliruptorales bacterium]